MIRDCQVDPERLLPIRECIDPYAAIREYINANPGRYAIEQSIIAQFDQSDPDEEWTDNVISKQAIAYSCGAICRVGTTLEHNHSPAELALCQHLAHQVAQIMAEVKVAGDEGEHPFLPFYVTANQGAAIPEQITEAVIRLAFGGTIHPEVQIPIEPLDEQGDWWGSVVSDGETNWNLAPWQAMIEWFHSQEELHSPVFVAIGDSDLVNTGSTFPRLMLALTKSGSLIGLCGQVVHT